MLMQATALEYRFRYLIHGLIYTVGFAAPWHWPPWDFVRNHSTLFVAANALAKPSYLHFALWWNVLVGVALAFAVGSAVLRTWGAAYLGAATVQSGSMVGNRVITDGPFRLCRNPLYFGTLLNALALAMLMRPEAGVITVILIAIVQFRLIGREEPFLRAQLGQPYAEYTARVPRFVPALRPRTGGGGLRPLWWQGVLSEVYVIGTAVAIAVFGWSSGYGWEGSVLHVMQVLLIALGLSFVGQALIPSTRERRP